MRMILIVLAALSCSHYAQATTQSAEDLAIQASLDARNDFVTALQNKDFEGITHDGFDAAIQELASQIRADHQDDVMANELLAQWNQNSASFSALLADRLANKDLGDHDPLFPWLNDFISKLAAKYGTLIYSLPIIQDIQTLNFAIPVVFSPQGSWQVVGTDNRIEYRKHFIPFANLVTYYVTLYGCQYVLHQHGADQLKKVCGKAADKLKFVMGRYIAPAVSDWIFKASSHTLQISDSQLHYNSVDDIRQAIQN